MSTLNRRVPRVSRLLILLLLLVSLFSLNLATQIRPAYAKMINGPMSPVWSPDGKHIAFTMVHEEHMTNEVFESPVFILDVDSGNLTKVVDDGSPSAWSSDGKQLLLSGVNKEGVFVVNADGTNLTKVASVGYAPTWSPDGKFVRFLLFDAIATIPIVPERVVGKGIKRIVEPKGQNISSYVWSPDGKQIAFTAFAENDNDGLPAVYLANADGSNLRKLAEGKLGVYVAWSPDGKYIVTTSDCGKQNGLCIWNSDGTAPRLLHYYGDSPNWSPDSKQIAYVEGGKICVIDADGTNRHCLTQDWYGNGVYWSPDGKRLMFTSMITETKDGDMKVTGKLSIINADGTGMKQLLPDETP